LSKIQGTSADRAIFHNLVIRENFFSNAGFETAGMDAALFDGWEVRAGVNVATQATAEIAFVHSGLYSACFGGTLFPAQLSAVSQDLDSALVNNQEFYAAGAMFIKGPMAAGPIPGVKCRNVSQLVMYAERATSPER
jgi:hypothetical protein